MYFHVDNPNYKPLSAVKPDIKDGWLLQFRGRMIQSKWIQFFTSGIHSHSAMTYIDKFGALRCLEMLQFKGGQSKTLLKKVLRWPKIIDVFEPNLDAFPHYDGEMASRYMFDLTDRKYGYMGIARLLAMKIPYVRRLVPYLDDDALKSDGAPFCSHAVAAACQFGGGQDAVPRKANCIVSPQDLTQSLLFNYKYTLVP